MGCSSSPSPESAQPPPAAATEPSLPTIVSGADDSVGAVPGSPDALSRFRFRQIDPPSDRFNFQDRDLSFYFKPAPDALHLQVENRQNRPVWIDWDRSVFYDSDGTIGKVAHSTTRWADRFQAQTKTQIAGLQRVSDFVFNFEDLLDPAGAPEQLHRQLLPEDQTAPLYADRSFGVDLAFLVEDKPRSYSFRFKVVSVIPR